VLGWSLLTISLLSSLFSLWSSRRNIRLRIYAEWEKDEEKQEAADKRASKWGNWTEGLDVAAVILLLTGLAMLIVFAKSNLGGM